MHHRIQWARLCVVLVCTLAASAALAGGVTTLSGSVIFDRSPATYAPGQPIKLQFRVNEYLYGSTERAYLAFAVVPASEPSNTIASRIARWPVHGALAGPKPGGDAGDSLLSAASPYELEITAPDKAGAYKVVMTGIPLFSNRRLESDGAYKRSFVPSPADRDALAKALRAYPSALQQVAKFTVSTQETAPAASLDVYLRLNGQPPYLTQMTGGLQDKAIVFSWSVQASPPVSSQEVEYRYRLQPTDTDWGVWTKERSISYAFLQRGVHRFEVQARRVAGGAVRAESRPAFYAFELPTEHVSRPQAKSPQSSGAGARPPVEFKNVYSKSRALLIGVWKFDDPKFTTFEQGKIAKDLREMETALTRNGFSVQQLQGERVSRDDIVGALSALVASARRDDRLLVYFSSHGFADPGNPSEGYIATSDCKYNAPEVRCLRLKDLEDHAQKALKSQDAKQILFAVDSCFSGLGVVRKAAPDSKLTNLSQLAAPKGAYMLTAGMATQEAQIDPALGMSTFTHYLVEGLNGGADLMGNGGLITLGQLYVYVQFKVAQKTDTQQIPMLGRISGDGEMLFWPPKK